MIPRPLRCGACVTASTLRSAVAVAALAAGLASCDGSSRDDSTRDSVVPEAEIAVADFEENEDVFTPDNDIAMTVRSVADAINIGEPIDSVDYSFKGVLTDGSGMPLFTDMEGLPGEWEVTVLSPSVVRIRNVNTGDLMPDELVGYLSAALQLDDDDTLELLSERESDGRKVSVFTFGRGTLTVETQPGSDATGEAGDLMQITMRGTREPSAPAAERDTTAAEAEPQLTSGDAGRGRQQFRHRQKYEKVSRQRSITRR